jgi:hypothetical protein
VKSRENADWLAGLQSLRWQISVKTLQRWRGLQTGPKFTKLQNRAVRYHLDDIKAYEAQRA